MSEEIIILPSDKVGIHSSESHKVVRGRTVFLRIVGERPQLSIMTATADEDRGDFLACKDRKRLLSAAMLLGRELNTDPYSRKDFVGREYINICSVILSPDGPTEGDKAKLYRVLERFFELFDGTDPSQPEQSSGLREIYDCFATDDSGEDVYLSDGIWLSSNGTLHDRGR